MWIRIQDFFMTENKANFQNFITNLPSFKQLFKT